MAAAATGSSYNSTSGRSRSTVGRCCTLFLWT